LSWFSFIDLLRMPITEILETHTEGQLIVLSLASRLRYEESKKAYNEASKTDTAKKQVSKMTKDELEQYYRESGM